MQIMTSDAKENSLITIGIRKNIFLSNIGICTDIKDIDMEKEIVQWLASPGSYKNHLVIQNHKTKSPKAIKQFI